MATPTFSWIPDWSYTGQHKPSVLTVQYGDGYQQRLVNGLNTDLRVWNLSFSVRTLAEIEAIESFLRSMQGATAFWFPIAGLTYTDTAMGFGVGDAVTTGFQLQRRDAGFYTNILGTWPVYTTPRTNLLLWSQDFTNAAWVKLNNGSAIPSVSANMAAAPDGTLTADQITFGAVALSTDYSVLRQSVAVAAGTYCESVWVQAADASQVGKVLVFALNDGTNHATQVTLSLAWTRVSLSSALIAATTSFQIYSSGTSSGGPNNSQTAAVANLWQFQGELGTTPTDYIPTGTAAVTVTPSYYPGTDGFEPIVNVNPATVSIYKQDWQGNQQLYPTQRTNLAYPSSCLGWSHGAMVVTTGIADPSGGTGASNFAYTATSYPQISLPTIPVVIGQRYTISCWVKHATAGIMLGITSNNGNLSATATTLSTGQWQRITATGMATATGNANFVVVLDNTGTSVSNNASAWGAQFETGGAATSLIPTTAAAVTITDYTMSTSGWVVFSSAPALSAVLTQSSTGTKQALVVCPQWTPPSPIGPNVFTLTATFNEVVA